MRGIYQLDTLDVNELSFYWKIKIFFKFFTALMPLVPTSATFLAVLSAPAEMSRSLNPELRASATVASSTPTRPAPPRHKTSAFVVGIELTLVNQE